MPKIIPDLHNRILEAASKLFATVGYANTDMKALAGELGISVGTLYNYFPSKPELFIEVTLRWRSNLVDKFSRIAESGGAPRRRLVEIMHTMLANAETFTGIWKEFIAVTQSKDPKGGAAWQQHHTMEEREKEFFERMRDLLRQILAEVETARPLLDDPKNRFVMMLVFPLINLAMRHPNEHAENARFLDNWIDFLFPKGEEDI